ncbi:MAG: hypothetical protein ACREC0_06120 [Methylocella sp.]
MRPGSMAPVHENKRRRNGAANPEEPTVHASAIGFIHVPQLLRTDRPKKASRGRPPSLGEVIRADLIAILPVARKLRHDLAKDRNSTSSHHNSVKGQWKGPELDPVLCMP